jgi:hypothetical protein
MFSGSKLQTCTLPASGSSVKHNHNEVNLPNDTPEKIARK